MLVSGTLPFTKGLSSSQVQLKMVGAMSLAGFDITFDVLARTQNTTVAHVLIPALESADHDLRMRAAQTLLSRGNEQGLGEVFLAIPQLGEKFAPYFTQFRKELVGAALKLLQDPPSLARVLPIIRQYQLTETATEIAKIALSSESFTVRMEAAEIVAELAWVLGRNERRPQTHSSTPRDHLVAKLTEAVRSDVSRRSPMLLDGFLSAVRWDDGVLKGIFDADDPVEGILIDRLSRSRLEGVVHLLAGWITRPRIPRSIQEVIKSRGDSLFRDQLIDAIGCDPTTTTVKNLRNLRPISCLRLKNVRWTEVEAKRQPALLRALAASEGDDLRVARFVLDVIREVESEEFEYVAAKIFSELKSIDPDLVVRSALAASRDDQALLDPAVKTIVQLLDLAGLGGPLAEGARHALQALRMDTLLEQIDGLHPTTARRLGALVRAIDHESIPRVEALLRHSVSRFRLLGMKAAVAMDIVDELLESWKRYFQRTGADQAEARVAAVEALRHGESAETLALLQEIAETGTGVVRAAAVEALAARLQSNPNSSEQVSETNIHHGRIEIA
jgi:hypothetical protein